MALTKEQVAARTGYIGGSDAAAVLGLSRWKTPLQVWGEKTGNIVPEEIEDSLPIKVGNRLEAVVAELFEEETGKRLETPKAVFHHPKYPFLAAQADRVLVDEDFGFEAKTASGWKADEWDGDEIPQEYLLQCHHGMLVTGKKGWYIACLIGGNQDFVWKFIERDEALLADMLRREVEFWNEYVVPRVMPGMISANDGETLYKLYPLADAGAEIALPADAEKIVARIKEIGTETVGQLAGLIAEKEQLRNQLKALLGPAALGTVGGWKVSWKNQSTGVRLDLDRLKAEKPEIYELYGKTGATRVMRIDAIKPPKTGKK